MKYASARAEAAQPEQRAGAGAVDNALDVADLKASENLAQAQQQGQRLAKGGSLVIRGTNAAVAAPTGGYKETQNYAQQARVVNGRAFYQNGATWTDATAQTKKDLKQKQVAFNSPEYFALLTQDPNVAQWLALGNEVDLVLGDTLYQIR
jgi:hypothetical protein